MAEITVQRLREKYPHPVKAALWMTGDYCVGGAFCHEAHAKLDGDHLDFPTAYELFRAVLEFRKLELHLLPDEDYDKMFNFADGVTKANDIGSFSTAWKLLGRLLTCRARQRMPQIGNDGDEM